MGISEASPVCSIEIALWSVARQTTPSGMCARALTRLPQTLGCTSWDLLNSFTFFFHKYIVKSTSCKYIGHESDLIELNWFTVYLMSKWIFFFYSHNERSEEWKYFVPEIEFKNCKITFLIKYNTNLNSRYILKGLDTFNTRAKVSLSFPLPPGYGT